VDETLKKLLLESYFEFKTVPCLLSMAHLSLAKQRSSTGHTHTFVM